MHLHCVRIHIFFQVFFLHSFFCVFDYYDFFSFPTISSILVEHTHDSFVALAYYLGFFCFRLPPSFPFSTSFFLPSSCLPLTTLLSSIRPRLLFPFCGPKSRLEYPNIPNIPTDQRSIRLPHPSFPPIRPTCSFIRPTRL